MLARARAPWDQWGQGDRLGCGNNGFVTWGMRRKWEDGRNGDRDGGLRDVCQKSDRKVEPLGGQVGFSFEEYRLPYHHGIKGSGHGFALHQSVPSAPVQHTSARWALDNTSHKKDRSAATNGPKGSPRHPFAGSKNISWSQSARERIGTRTKHFVITRNDPTFRPFQSPIISGAQHGSPNVAERISGIGESCMLTLEGGGGGGYLTSAH